MWETLLGYLVKGIKDEKAMADEARERDKKCRDEGPFSAAGFVTFRSAGDLVEPSRKAAKHHREREQHWTKELEKAETELREKGINLDIVDSYGVGYGYTGGMVASGAISSSVPTNFQPVISQQLMDAVKRAKGKMLDHRGKAEQYEKYARAYRCSPKAQIRLTIEDIHYFRLES